MKRVKYTLVILVLTFSNLTHAQSLDDYLKIAAENNPGLKAKYAEFEAATARVAQVKSLEDPTLSFGYFISPVETRVGPQRAKIGLSQMFPWFGTLAAKGDMTALIAEAKYQEFLNTKNELFFKVKAAWYPLYEVDNIIKFQKENLKIINSYKQISMSSFKNGKGSMVDVVRVEILIENTTTDIKLLEAKKKPLLTQFNKLLNRADSLPVDIVDPLPVFRIEEGLEKDSLLTSNPILAAFDLKLESAKAQEKVARKQGLPKLGIGLDYVIVDKRTDVSIPDNGKDAIMPMVSLSIPIFRGKYKSAVKEAQFTQSAITAYKEDYKNTLISKYEMTWYQLEKAVELIDLYRIQVEKTEQVVNLLLVAYSNSGNDFEEILRMQQELLKYQMAETTALKDYYTSIAELDYITAKSE